MESLIGTGVALVTPFTNEGTVDTDSLKKLVHSQIDNGIDYLVVLGTTAEVATLTDDEKQLVINTIIKVNDNRLPLVIGIGGNDTAAVVETINSTDLTAFEAILSVSPAYNKPSQQGIYEHFSAIAQATDKPILLYNVPGRTASTMALETVVRLAHDHDNIMGIKEAAGDLVAAMNMIQYSPKDFLVISGDDMIANAMTLAGGAGVISVIAQGLPQDFSDMIRYALNGDVEESYELHYKMAASIDLIFKEGNPAGIKELLAQLDISSNRTRLPLVKATKELSREIKTFLNQYDN